jgi:signal transduction histidine kinase
MAVPEAAAVHATAVQDELASLYAMSVELAGLHELPQVLDTALGFCLELTASTFGFVGLLNGQAVMDVAAIKGFSPADPSFYDRYRAIPVHPNVFGVVILEGRPKISNDVPNDPVSRGHPHGHPPVQTFLGVPLLLRGEIIGMLGVANRPGGYAPADERLLVTFANQVAIAIANARLYEQQRAMIDQLQELHRRLDAAQLQELLTHERQRIARELHDRVQQTIFAMGLRLGSLLEGTEPIGRRPLEELRALAGCASEQVKEAIFALSAPELQGGHLVGELGRLVRELSATTSIVADLLVHGPARLLPPAVEEALFAVAREALSNIRRHSGATTAVVTLHCSPDDVSLAVQDDGAGIPKLMLESYRDSTTHHGLRGMCRRVEELGGRFLVENGEERGVVVRAWLPLAEPALPPAPSPMSVAWTPPLPRTGEGGGGCGAPGGGGCGARPDRLAGRRPG